MAEPIVDEERAAPLLTAGDRKCRVCGCTQYRACLDPEHGPCWWVAPDLCSHCVEPRILIGEYDRMADAMMAAGDRPVTPAELDQFFSWTHKARVALERAASSDPDIFEVRSAQSRR